MDIMEVDMDMAVDSEMDSAVEVDSEMDLAKEVVVNLVVAVFHTFKDKRSI